jgi:hypothetical protein
LIRSITINGKMRDQEELFCELAKSHFRRRFRLGAREKRYLADKGLSTIIAHARDFITERLSPADPPNDGKQTPMASHPVFIAQHATATCCRSCLAKWHRIAKGAALTAAEADYVVGTLLAWLERQAPLDPEPGESAAPQRPQRPTQAQRKLFD